MTIHRRNNRNIPAASRRAMYPGAEDGFDRQYCDFCDPELLFPKIELTVASLEEGGRTAVVLSGPSERFAAAGRLAEEDTPWGRLRGGGSQLG
jgi:hypothetical protein